MKMKMRIEKNERVNILDDYDWNLDSLIDKLIELQEENERLLDKIGGMEDRIKELDG